MEEKTFWKQQVSNRLVAICGLIMVLVAGGIYGGYYLYLKNKITTSTTTVTTSPTTTTITTASTSPVVDRIVDVGVTWTSPPQKLADLGIFAKVSEAGSGGYEATDYYKIGFTSTADIILARVKLAGMGDYYYNYRFLKTDSKYELIVKNSDSYIDDYKSDFVFKASYTANNTFVLKSLLPDAKIIDKNTVLTQGSSISNHALDFNLDIKGQKIYSTKWGDINYQVTTPQMKATTDSKSNGIDLSTGLYYLVLNDSTRVAYEPKPSFLRDDNTFDVTWSVDGLTTQAFTKIRTSGCGLSGGIFPVAADKTALVDKESIATSKSGAKLFTIKNAGNSLIKLGYAAYTLDQGPNKVSIDQFTTNHGIILWTDDLGNTIIYLSDKYQPQVECGKPVIYLYPTKDTQVSIKVGAQITKSDPIYQDGWRGIAHSDGTVTVNGQTYPSLFWEGLGNGVYPEIKSGRVVATNNVKEEITKDLASMNLNSREISDFLDFWMPKMPANPYVRLTWLTNNDMNLLAPLQVNPAPQSVIRVFLDFAGLNQKIDLPSQILPKNSRTGYTLVEWGGLLTNKK